jgi:hypothetical protein
MGQWWPETLALLLPALGRFDGDQVELETDLARGRAQLWLVCDPAPIAAMVTRDGDTEFEIWLAGGRCLSLLAFLEPIETAFRDTGKTRGRLKGRNGWARVLSPFGWQADGDELVKELARGK